MFWYPAYIAKHSSRIQHFYVSSDSEEILDVTGEFGFRAIKRPQDLAQPDTLHVDTIRHALEFMEHEDGLVPDTLIVLLGNTVSFKRSWIDFSVDSRRTRVVGNFPTGYSAMMLVGARLRHISTTKWGSGQ